MQHIRKQLALHLFDLSAVLGACQVVADDTFTLMDNALDDHALCTHLKQGVDVFLNKRLVDILTLIGNTGKNGGLGKVGRQHIGAVD